MIFFFLVITEAGFNVLESLWFCNFILKKKSIRLELYAVHNLVVKAKNLSGLCGLLPKSKLVR